ncbi:MAG TPA: ABC transporter permease [Methanocorpusculum sp.]|nr:ABC transporter permease [Methanocorpusculum sp.]HJK80972.1 ABC transporter permease [Methanocorpusculum sp.]
MNKTLQRKLIRYSISILIIILIVFAFPRVMPGNPVMFLIGEDILITPDVLEDLHARLGLDKPVPEQFLLFVQRLFSGDLGYSYHLHSPVASLIGERAVWTLLLVGTSLGIGYASGIIFGTWAGWMSKKKFAKVLTGAGICISCIPPYLLGLILFSVFVYHLNWFPYKGLYTTPDIFSVMHHLALPIATLSLFVFARNLLIMRGSVLAEKNQLYPQFARSLGVSAKKILYGHVMKNAILPVLTQFAIDFGFIFSGALFIEIIFSLNGLGTLMYDAIITRDYPVLSGLFLIIAVMAVIANMVADLLYGIVDPRVSREEQEL